MEVSVNRVDTTADEIEHFKTGIKCQLNTLDHNAAEHFVRPAKTAIGQHSDSLANWGPSKFAKLSAGRTWDPTICEHCGGRMSEPRMMVNEGELGLRKQWVNTCLNCGQTRGVLNQSPLLQRHLEDLQMTPYPDMLNDVGPRRPWVPGTLSSTKIATTSGDYVNDYVWDKRGKVVEADYYHVAPTTERARIKQHGLQPSKPSLNPIWGPGREDLLGGQPDGVYVWEGLPWPNDGVDPWEIRKEMGSAVQGEHAGEDDIWRIRHEDAPIVDKDLRGGPNARVIPHVVYPELYEGGPEVHGPWPKRGKLADLQTPMGYSDMYHVSPRANREKILAEGLQGHSEDRVSPWDGAEWPRHDQPHGNYLYGDPHQAEAYAHTLWGRRLDKPSTAWEDRYEWPTPPDDFHEWPDEQQDAWHDEHEPTELHEDPNGYDLWKVQTHGLPIGEDPESRVKRGIGTPADRQWDIGRIHDVENGDATDPWGNQTDLNYWGNEESRFYVPQEITPDRLQLHKHIPMWGDRADEQWGDLIDEGSATSYPSAWYHTPWTERPWPGHESKFAEVIQHQLWFKPGPRAERLQTWGRGLLHEPTGIVHTWPEKEGTHVQMMDAKGLNPLETVPFYVWPDGTLRAPPMFQNTITQADPRLTAPPWDNGQMTTATGV